MNWREKWLEVDSGGDKIEKMYELANGGWLVKYYEHHYSLTEFDKDGKDIHGDEIRLLPVPSPPQVVPFTADTAPDDILRVRRNNHKGCGWCVYSTAKNGVHNSDVGVISWERLAAEYQILRLSTGWVPGGEVKQ